MLGKFFGWAEYIGCPPNVIVGWATAPWVPSPLGVACAVRQQVTKPQVLTSSQQNCSKQETVLGRMHRICVAIWETGEW